MGDMLNPLSYFLKVIQRQYIFGPGVSMYLPHEDTGHPQLPKVKLVQKAHIECVSMIQCDWHGIDGTEGLEHWTHGSNGSLLLV